jgi:5-methylcytosine-specific restriction protein A
MPSAPLRPCSTPGCGVLVAKGKCPTHARTKELHRGSRHERGYDNAWLRLRAWFISQPENVLCVRCTREGRTTRAQEVDHIVEFKGVHDPLRLDPRNLQSLCIPCHRAKHFSPPGGTVNVCK